PDPLQRRERTHQHVIDAPEFARLLDRRHVLRLLDYADDVTVARVAAAERTGIDVGDVVAHRAVRDALLPLAHAIDQPFGVLARRLEDVEGEPLRALRTDSGQALELLDEMNQRLGQQDRNAECGMRNAEYGSRTADCGLRTDVIISCPVGACRPSS